ncbi:MAG: phage head closure protein [Anaerolineaceae bacterium]|nr:phage head closure protein [Anaerolineaceae bacterium]
MDMQAGMLRHRITIKYKEATQDATYNEEQVSWTTLVTVWASVEPLQGREFLDAKQVQAEVSTRIRMRYLGTVRPTMRVYFGSRVFEVLAVIDVRTRYREMQLMCVERIED